MATVGTALRWFEAQLERARANIDIVCGLDLVAGGSSHYRGVWREMNGDWCLMVNVFQLPAVGGVPAV